MKLFHDLADIFYPTTCPGCGKVVERDRGWCEDCLKRVWNPRLLNSSHTDHLHGCYTLCNYEGAVRKIIIQLKYGGRIDRKKAFPPLLSRFPYWGRLAFCSLVIPVPLSQKKWDSRGYNQVDMMFEEWMEKAGNKYLPRGLVRFRAAETQSLLSRSERYDNIKGIFHINRNVDVRGKYILLVENSTLRLIQMNETPKAYTLWHFRGIELSWKCFFYALFPADRWQANRGVHTAEQFLGNKKA